jgi:hypothetical protein
MINRLSPPFREMTRMILTASVRVEPGDRHYIPKTNDLQRGAARSPLRGKDRTKKKNESRVGLPGRSTQEEAPVTTLIPCRGV